MLRILHSLPRTHKLLLLPVATMVTVLGAQKIITLVGDTQGPDPVADTHFLPLSPESRPGLPSLNTEHLPVADAIAVASQALDATRETIPLSQLVPSEIVELESPAGNDEPNIETAGEPLTAGLSPATQEGDTAPSQIDDAALHIALVLGTLTSGMLDDSIPAGDDTPATSYDDVSDEELALFDEGPIILEEEIAASEPYVPEWETYTVESGDTFVVLAQNRLGLGYGEAMELLESLPEPRLLTHWRPGNQFEYQLDEEGQLALLRMMKNGREGVIVERTDEAFDVATIERTGEAAQRLFAGTVSGSFVRSAQATGLSISEVTQVSRLLEKKLDFRRDTRRGDEFQVLVESDVIDGESFDSRVLAVRYLGERMNLTVVRNSADNNFYTPDGASLDPAFRRRPFDGSYRLSSSFNPNRKHPVTGRISPHRGTDFAMPIGTPIVAPANGRVEKVGNHPLAGRYVVIRHDNGYRTRYLHLSRQLVSRGERVTMGERIALSGNTGRSTGPHLHYEVHVNDSAVDAMKVSLPENTSLSGEALAAFQNEAEPLLATLESGETGPVVASTASEREAADDDS
ncbi:peptidoglycan DD-metalloendopeptidase family protein [Billgrantia gudaonensis]|uniref:Murein DD-endopeptidase n=1 Tax=Billgrantia gudaonensis TaxID=376427 RepID=A0A1G8ZNU2_9GAMM|nr:peptidoglycan DD-metalloendopeptidase family protein [Halomonas gudaonensis]SDK16721.1 murein DD-endopeptidase [Halomonas gudaonensis]